MSNSMRKIIDPMFETTEYFYNKTVKFLLTHSQDHIKFIFNKFLMETFDKQVCDLTLTTLTELAKSLNISERIFVSFNYMKKLSKDYESEFKISDLSVRNKILSSRMDENHVEYWTKNTPRHARAEACFEAVKNYKTAIYNYTNRAITRYLGYVKNNKLRFQLAEFTLNTKLNTKSIGIESRTINFTDNIIMPSCTRYASKQFYKYSIKPRDKSRVLNLINDDLDKISDSQLLKINGEYFLCLVITLTKQLDVSYKLGVISLDPGVRTFMTGYSPSGFIYEFGNNYNKLLVRRGKKISSYQSRLEDDSDDILKELISEPDSCDDDQLLEIKTVIKRMKKKRYRIRRKIRKSWIKTKNIIDDLHKKTASELINTFDTIIIPDTNISDMVRKYDRCISKSTANSLLQLSHYKFREHLIQKSKQTNTQVMVVSEAFTSKTCGNCGSKHETLGGNKIFTCKKCNYTCGRDIHGARNILIRAMSNIPEDMLVKNLCL